MLAALTRGAKRGAKGAQGGAAGVKRFRDLYVALQRQCNKARPPAAGSGMRACAPLPHVLTPLTRCPIRTLPVCRCGTIIVFLLERAPDGWSAQKQTWVFSSQTCVQSVRRTF